ncbi:helix-turn-helix transcriptional regulator [Primorskyibacter sp. S87]|uniref:helix-turn-helix transcriptional regulator n=1 Tax=Primorskyibacter sp. S87 TaxID=3415126 RepID=UPI003C7D59D0
MLSDSPHFLSTRQAADRIGISPRTLTRMLRRGNSTPPVIRINARTFRWRSDDVDQWVRQQTLASNGVSP